MGVSRVPVKEAAAVIVTLALVSVARGAWEAAHSGYQTLTSNGPSLSDRELGDVLDGDLDQALRASRRVIPQNATFSIRVGQDPPVDHAIQDAIPGIFRYWLLPRVFDWNDRKVDWVITFHHPADTLGVPVRRVIPLGWDTSAVEVAR
jgi:hypothetical protein